MPKYGHLVYITRGNATSFPGSPLFLPRGRKREDPGNVTGNVWLEAMRSAVPRTVSMCSGTIYVPIHDVPIQLSLSSGRRGQQILSNFGLRFWYFGLECPRISGLLAIIEDVERNTRKKRTEKVIM